MEWMCRPCFVVKIAASHSNLFFFLYITIFPYVFMLNKFAYVCVARSWSYNISLLKFRKADIVNDKQPQIGNQLVTFLCNVEIIEFWRKVFSSGMRAYKTCLRLIE